MVTLLPISIGAILYTSYIGIADFWWAMPLGYVGGAGWLVHVSMNGKVKEYLKSREVNVEE
jgi:hypothetical protein